MPDPKFDPFYERMARYFRLGIVGRVLIALAPGAVFFLPYFALQGSAAFSDWSWLLAIIITAGFIFLYFATATLLDLFPQWDRHFGEENRRIYLVPLSATLTDRRFVAGGLFFGTLNLAMGICFGVSAAPVTLVWLYFGFFLAGFICGLPAIGIFGVVRSFSFIVHNGRLTVDYAAPDGCGGMAFIGDALVKFGIVTLMEGLLIATYILKFPWLRGDNPWVQLLMWVWIAFPFLLSILVVLAPAVEVRNLLVGYRDSQERELRLRSQEVRSRAENPELGSDQRAGHRAEYTYLLQQRQEVHKMRSWPFSTASGATFCGALVTYLPLAKSLVEKLLKSALGIGSA